MSTSVTLLFNALNLATNVDNHGIDELQLAVASRLIGTMFADYPYEVDNLEQMVRRHGSAGARSAFNRFLQVQTARMPEHPFFAARFPSGGGELVAFTVNISHLQGMHLTSLEDCLWELRERLSAEFGLDKSDFEVSPLLFPADEMYEASPYGIHQTCRTVLNDMFARENDTSYHTTRTNRCFLGNPAEDGQGVTKEYLMFAVFPLGERVVPAVTAVHRALPCDIGFFTLPVAVEQQSGTVNIQMSLTHVGTPYEAARTALYSSSIIRLIAGCYTASLGSRQAFDARARSTTVDQMARSLTGKAVHVHVIQGPLSPGVRVSVFDSGTGQLLGGMFIDEVAEPSALLSRMALLFPSRLSHSWRKEVPPSHDTENGLVHFFEPRTGQWVVPDLRIRITL